MNSLSSLYYSQIGRQFPITNGNSSKVIKSDKTSTAQGTGPLNRKDQVIISIPGQEDSEKNTANPKTSAESFPTSSSANNQVSQSLSTLQLSEIQQLKKRDTDVRAHEQAHLSVAGRYATGGASYSYQTGPDGVRYAVGGEVPIDISSEKSPEATIQKMETIRRAALAPLDPSSADLQIAAQATAKELQAMQQLRIQESGKATSQDSAKSSTGQNENGPKGPLSSSDPGNTSSGLSSGNDQQIMIKAYQNILSLA